MNLPAAAPEFMDAFAGAFDPAAWPDPAALPTVHLYAFSRAVPQRGGGDSGAAAAACVAACAADILGRVERALGVPPGGVGVLGPGGVEAHEV
jgi:hypothetical protein